MVIPYHPYVQTKQLAGIDGGKPSERLPLLNDDPTFEEALGAHGPAPAISAAVLVEGACACGQGGSWRRASSPRA